MTETASKPKPNLGVERLTPDEQKRRFLETCREAAASDDPEEFRAMLRKIAKLKGPLI